MPKWLPELRREKSVEQFSTDIVIANASGLRAVWSRFRRSFWPSQPAYSRTRVNYDLARQLYRNDGKGSNLGSQFGRPIVDAQVDFIGIPIASSGDEIIDDLLNKAMEQKWAPIIRGAFKDAIRDSLCIIRLRRYSISNILVGAEENEMGYLEIVPPETVDIYYAQGDDSTIIEKVVIAHTVEIVEDMTPSTGGSAYQRPITRQHVIYEEITPEDYTYYDETEGRWLDDLRRENSWGFVPVVEMFHEWDATLNGGQSDLESAYPFILAFHEVLGQSLGSHKMHSTPKAHFKINDINTFMMSNFPDAYDQDNLGNPIPGTFSGEVTWKGTEILFTQPDEDATFLEAKSILGDSKELLGFLIDCICIASKTPRAVFNLDVGAADKNEILPFVKKVIGKRIGFQVPIQMLWKMLLATNKMVPTLVPVGWDAVTSDEYLTQMDAFQRKVMALEVTKQSRIISDKTYRHEVRSDLKSMKSPSEEERDAEDNFELPLTSPNGSVPVVSGKQGENE